MANEEWVNKTWEAMSRGDLAPLEAALAPDAQWRAVDDGPWNCPNKVMILDAMRFNLANGRSGQVEEVVDHGDRIVVAFRPDHHDPGAWPLDNGLRYMVVTVADGKVTEMKACLDRAIAVEYAGSIRLFHTAVHADRAR